MNDIKRVNCFNNLSYVFEFFIFIERTIIPNV